MHKFRAAVHQLFDPGCGQLAKHIWQAKWLILMKFIFCTFSRQINEGLDFQGFPAGQSNLSTKLSTDPLDRSVSASKSTT
jgi:hypothetical protein